MILGIGIDTVQIPRVERIALHYGKRFSERVCHVDELEALDCKESEKKRHAYIAKRFAAKEAFAKACGHGFRDGLNMKDIAVVNDASGQPNIKLSDKLYQQLFSDRTLHIHVSLTDDYPVAQAIVVIDEF